MGGCLPSGYLESVGMLDPRSISLSFFHCPNFLAAKAKKNKKYKKKTVEDIIRFNVVVDTNEG